MDQEERLAVVIEEIGEVLQMIGKVERFGWENFHPGDLKKQTNRELLENELADLRAAISLMEDAGDVSTTRILALADAKKRLLPQWLLWQKREK